MSLNVKTILVSYLEIDIKNHKDEFWEELSWFAREEGKLVAQMGRNDGDLETDGNVQFRSTGTIVYEGEAEVDEELCRRIATQLAEMGDKLEREMRIKPEVVNGIVDALLNHTLNEEYLAATVQSLVQTAPPGVEQELMSVAIALILTKKAVTNVPSLLHNICCTTTHFIERNYRACLERLARQNDQIVEAKAELVRRTSLCSTMMSSTSSIISAISSTWTISELEELFSLRPHCCPSS
ncbi:hypothetical protein XELAEV_18019855mg [Xenopus laevis]|uniref:BH3-interacting domain death agonist n=1 Tax=Xenopus laevis TaxID=8355 RepID=A0A974HQF6_XENLA|nr:hypothetical protein XELAEV_18019855mg [Xenopus laevis]